MNIGVWLGFKRRKAERLSSCTERRPIGLRPPSDQIPFAVRSDSVRRPMSFVGDACRSLLRFAMQLVFL